MNLVEITIRATDSDALGKITEIKVALDSLHNKTIQVNEDVDRNGNKFSGWLMKLANLIPGVTANSGMAAAGFVALGVAGTAALVSIGAALMPLIISLGIVAAGIVGFTALAVPEFTKVWTAVGQGRKAIDALPPALKPVANQLVGLKDEFGKLSKAIQPYIIKAFAESLKIVKDLMPALRPLLVATGKAIDGLLKNVEQWLNSPAGKKFIAWFQNEAPIALRNFARVAWDIIRGVGSTLHFLWDTGETFARHWVTFWHTASHAIDSFRIGFIQMGHLVESIYNSIKSATTTALNAVKAAWNAVANAIQSAVNFIVGLVNRLRAIFGQIPGFIRAGVAGVAGILIAPFQAAFGVIMGIIHGIEAAVGGIAGAISGAIGAARSAAGAIGGIIGHFGLASGGIVGAASGMARSGLTLVGEHGPELVRLPAGSSVHSNPDTQRMMSGGSARVELVINGSGDLWEFMRRGMRAHIRKNYQGNVSLALGT